MTKNDLLKNGDGDEGARARSKSTSQNSSQEDDYEAAVLALIEFDRSLVEGRATKPRILHDIVKDMFEAKVVFEQHYAADLTAVSSFAVFQSEKSVRSEVKALVKGALKRIGVEVKWEGRDVKDVPLGNEPASSHEKMELLTSINGAR
ncbi:hypothetical protein [Ruegeria sp. Ofav3-42]|uniref:hypothetical protein n=1 Tax=Ruegeria sp. Ofav3-42 TaxID=2917759 RepID=UPI001EF49173|nr:hypothetical protein [Ruegeria sp. Ofav3-42]MCG7519064.1 hypothetical protein [Ruegeria sp. Ofav3-42]